MRHFCEEYSSVRGPRRFRNVGPKRASFKLGFEIVAVFLAENPNVGPTVQANFCLHVLHTCQNAIDQSRRLARRLAKTILLGGQQKKMSIQSKMSNSVMPEFYFFG